MTDDLLLERCQQVFEQLTRGYYWTMVKTNEAAFIAEVYKRVSRTAPTEAGLDEVIKRAVKNVYCARLYDAYRLDGTEQQKLAMSEVKDFVFRRLLMKAHNDARLADECAQKAVEQAWFKWHTIQAPGSFLGFVLRIGIHELIDRQRQDARLVDMPEEVSSATEGKDQWRLTADTVEWSSEWSDLRRRLVDAIQKCVERVEEARLLVEMFLDGKTYNELAVSWGKEASYLHLLKFRALKNLRACEDFLVLKRDWAFD